MFSEYASRFLAQSQSRLLTSQADQTTGRNANERHDQRGPSRTQYPLPPYGSNQNNNASTTQPPGSAQPSRFPFAARLSTAPAPLFYSANDDFREEDDGEEHEREVADYYALQRSRRDFGNGRMALNRDPEDRISERQGATRSIRASKLAFSSTRPAPRRMGGIRSSWSADDDAHATDRPRETSVPGLATEDDTNKDRMVDVELSSTIPESEEYEDEADLIRDGIDEDDPPSVQQFRRDDGKRPLLEASRTGHSMHPERLIADSRLGPADVGAESIAPTAPPPPSEPPRHDAFFSQLYLISMAALLATFLLVWLHTSAPKKSRLGDTVYTALHACFYLFAWDTVISVLVALVWLTTLRAFARPLVYLLVIAVPVVLFSFSLYSFISSFRGSWSGSSIQDRLMRWGSLVPLASTFFWIYTVYKGRRSLDRAIAILEFAVRILAACPALVPVGFGALAAVVAWTWIWMLMFTRIFLGGHENSKHLFILSASTWWQGVFFILMYLWTLGVLAGVQRSITAATVSQWYFHRLTVPAPSSQRVVMASLNHATTIIFGTICFSTLLALGVRLPLLVLPRKLSSWISFCFYSVMPASIAALTNPLTLTYAAIHSQPLGLSARGLSELSFISKATTTTTLTPNAFRATPGDPSPSLFGYRLAKLMLHATRFITSFAFGFGGWVSTARVTQVGNAGYRGSLYAYVVGLIAGTIGWAVLGAMEGVLGGILDAVVVCWGSEVGSQGFGMARYCREAGELLQGEDDHGGLR